MPNSSFTSYLKTFTKYHIEKPLQIIIKKDDIKELENMFASPLFDINEDIFFNTSPLIGNLNLFPVKMFSLSLHQ